MSGVIYKAYFDRNIKSIEGLFSIKEVDHRKPKEEAESFVFEKIAVRSGISGLTHTNWVRGKSPIPFGKYWLSTRSVPLQMEPVGTPFFPISTFTNNPSKIVGTNPGEHRVDIGLHMENRFPGSAGCIVILRKDIAKLVFDFLHDLNAKGVTHIPLEVL